MNLQQLGSKLAYYVAQNNLTNGKYELVISNGEPRISSWTYAEPQPALEDIDKINTEQVKESRKVKTVSVAVVSGILDSKKFKQGDLIYHEGRLKILIGNEFLQI